MKASEIKPPWYLKLEMDKEAVEAAARLRLAIDEADKLPAPDDSYNYSDCIGTWNRGERARIISGRLPK